MPVSSFGLVSKKSYGNEDAHDYCKWFRPFAEGFSRVLKENGSLVIDIGGAWKPGTPTRSLYHFELLLMLCEDYGFHLCQEHYWWNPSKLPTPAEWVNVRRVRVKDAVNSIWWLSPMPWPKANNRRVLAPYSESMRHLLKHGYKAKLRPSGVENGEITRSSEVDRPERLGRKWVCSELVEDYLKGARGRFEKPSVVARPAPDDDDAWYRVPRPGLLWNGPTRCHLQRAAAKAAKIDEEESCKRNQKSASNPGCARATTVGR
jgi:hypothetical protein